MSVLSRALRRICSGDTLSTYPNMANTTSFGARKPQSVCILYQKKVPVPCDWYYRKYLIGLFCVTPKCMSMCFVEANRASRRIGSSEKSGGIACVAHACDLLKIGPLRIGSDRIGSDGFGSGEKSGRAVLRDTCIYVLCCS